MQHGFQGAAYRLGNRLAGRGRVAGRPVFVTGNGRSGTSWIGQTLGQAPGVLYYREPCHPYRNGVPDADAHRIWTRYLRPGERDRFFERTLGAAFEGHFWPGSGHPLRAYGRRIGRRPRVLVKEVAAFLSLAWVAARWDPHVLVILRHPGAYAASVRRMDRPEREVARLRLLREDARLVAGHLGGLEAHLAAIDTPLEASVAAWGIRTRVALAELARRPDWTAVHYEDVARDPPTEFRRLYDRFGLGWSDRIEAWTRAKTTAEAEGQFTTSRVSQARIDAWRGQLTAEETTRVRRTLEPFDLPIYAADADWSFPQQTAQGSAP